MKNIETIRTKLLNYISNLSEKDMTDLAESICGSADHSFTAAGFEVLARTGITYDNTVCTLCSHCPIKEADGVCNKQFSEWALAEVTK